MSLVKWIITSFAPIFIVTSPVTSYGDQIWAMNKKRTSAGFSLDIPLIMLVASITKVFYWIGARYDVPLLIQASVMVVVQVVLLHVALVNRPPFGAQYTLNQPFAGATEEPRPNRPFNFWQWRDRKPYWEFIAGYVVVLAVLQLLAGHVEFYIGLQGYLALGVEAILPLPQVLENHKKRSCKGFRLSVLANWLIGDVFKLSYFFLSEGGVPWAFKLCGLLQTVCDCYLGIQYWMYRASETRTDVVPLKDTRLP